MLIGLSRTHGDNVRLCRGDHLVIVRKATFDVQSLHCLGESGGVGIGNADNLHPRDLKPNGVQFVPVATAPRVTNHSNTPLVRPCTTTCGRPGEIEGGSRGEGTCGPPRR